MRAPSASCSWWKRTSFGDWAVVSLTGTLTNPKLTDPLQMARGMRTFFPMREPSYSEDSIDAVATRLVSLLTGDRSGLRDPSGGELVFEPDLSLRPLQRAPEPPPQAWAVDGGQTLVADARCFQVYATRASRLCWSAGSAVVEEALPVRAWLLGLGESAAARLALEAPVAGDCC